MTPCEGDDAAAPARLDLLDILEASRFLGIDRSSLYRLAKAGKIGYHQIRGSLTFSLDDLRAYDRSQPIPKPKGRRSLK